MSHKAIGQFKNLRTQCIYCGRFLITPNRNYCSKCYTTKRLRELREIYLLKRKNGRYVWDDKLKYWKLVVVGNVIENK